jgi:hypothetical protein
MFMGNAQLIELRLKGLLVNKYGLKERRIEKWPLGQVIAELEKRKFRQDFLGLLVELKEHRNDIAHQLLADDVRTTTVTHHGTGVSGCQ